MRSINIKAARKAAHELRDEIVKNDTAREEKQEIATCFDYNDLYVRTNSGLIEVLKLLGDNTDFGDGDNPDEHVRFGDNPCVYSGAMVLLEDYNALVRCDLREIEGAVLIHVQGEWIFNASRQQLVDRVTHRVSGDGYVSSDKKVIFVRADQCIGERR